MLSHFTFQSHMQRLADAFGESQKEKFDKKMGVYFDVLREKISDQQLVRAVDHLVQSSERFPTIKTVLEIAYSYPDPTVVREKTPCPVCNGKGTLATTLTEHGLTYGYIFKCSECDNGPENYPVWHEACRARGHKPDVKDYGRWDTEDEWQIKGLVMLGSKSMAWKKASDEMRKKAIELWKLGWRPKNMLFRGEKYEARQDRHSAHRAEPQQTFTMPLGNMSERQETRIKDV